jgi:hypothetical protein
MPAPFGSIPTTASPGVDNAAVWPPLPQPAATTDKVVEPITPSIPETSPSQASASPQISAQAGEPDAAPLMAPPDAPPAVGTIKAEESIAESTDARADMVDPKADALVSDNAGSTARDSEPTAKIPLAGSLRLTPKIFLIVALALAVVGTLFRILMKIAAARRGRTATAGMSGETIKAGMAPSMGGTTRPDRRHVTATTSHAEPRTTSGWDNSAGMSGDTIKATMAPTMGATTRPNRRHVTNPSSDAEPTTTNGRDNPAGMSGETIKASMALSMSGKTRPNRRHVTSPSSHSEPTTTSGWDNASDKNEIRNEDETLAQLNQGLDDLVRAHGISSRPKLVPG